LFIAIIALAAAPQALLDAHRLVSAAQERAETEFWSVFLSYQTPAANGTEKRAATELVAARRRQEEKDACPLQRTPERAVRVASDSQSNDGAARARAAGAEAVRASAKANRSVPQTVEADFDDGEEVARVFTVRTVGFTEKEQKALGAAGLHARDTEKIVDAASRASLASFSQGKENLQIKMKQMMEMDKLLRQRPRSNRDRSESFEVPTPNPIGSM
jgi:hypothetical protein